MYRERARSNSCLRKASSPRVLMPDAALMISATVGSGCVALDTIDCLYCSFTFPLMCRCSTS